MWEQAIETFMTIEEAYQESDSEKERRALERSIVPDHAIALLELKRVQEAYDLLSPMMPDRNAEGVTQPTAGAIMAYGRTVAGWLEGDANNPTIVPGVGTPEDYSKAVQWTQKLAGQFDRFEPEWYPSQAQLGMLYLSWGRLDSSKREFAKKQLSSINSSFGPTYRELGEQLGDEQVLAVRIGQADIRVAGVDPELSLATGTRVDVAVPMENLHLFDMTSGAAIR